MFLCPPPPPLPLPMLLLHLPIPDSSFTHSLKPTKIYAPLSIMLSLLFLPVNLPRIIQRLSFPSSQIISHVFPSNFLTIAYFSLLECDNRSSFFPFVKCFLATFFPLQPPFSFITILLCR